MSEHPAQWVALLGERLACRAQRPLFTFLEDGERPSDTLTPGALERRARQIAVQLAETCAPGDRALLLYPAGLDFVTALFGCLYAGVVAVPAPPPEASRLKRTLPPDAFYEKFKGVGFFPRSLRTELWPSRGDLGGFRVPCPEVTPGGRSGCDCSSLSFGPGSGGGMADEKAREWRARGCAG